MMLWGDNKKEIEDLQKKVDRAISDICLLQQNVELIKTNQTSLRGLVNRKLEYPAEKKETDRIEEIDNNIKPSVFLNPNGLPL